MNTSPLRLLALWLCLLLALGSCSADSLAPEGIGGAPSTPPQEPQGGSAMTASLKIAVLRARQTAAGYAFTRDASGALRARAGGFGATAEVAATPRGVRLSRAEDGGFQLGIETTSVGRDGSPGSRGVVDQHAEGQELVQGREDGVEERYLAGPLGLEQSFVVRSSPAGTGPLAIEVAFTGLTPELAEGAPSRVLLRDEAGRVRAGYRDLVAVDAEGWELGARMDVGEAGVTLVVDDTAAVYPLRVDPLVVWTQQPELTASDGAMLDEFGWSVAVSGGTAIVGAYGHTVGSNADQGAAYVFVQSGTTWTQQQELTASDGAEGDSFGYSVAVSGGTAVVGAPTHLIGDNVDQGASYVFVQSGTTWTQQQELTASNGAGGDEFGSSVAVSGGTAVVGAYAHTVGSNADQGAAYVFVQSGTTWTQQQELTASDGAADDFFGISVAVSGGTALVGALQHEVGGNIYQGTAYVFVQNGATWTQQQELTASDGAADQRFGTSVAMSGGTAVVGAEGHQVGANADQGAAYVFVQSGATWTQQEELTASDGAAYDFFGASVAVSGSTAVVGVQGHQVGGNADQGAAYVFVQSGTTWTQQQELTASDGAADDRFGYSVAVSGSTAVVGAFHHDVGSDAIQGATYVFAPACYIGGVPYGTGAVNPANACQVCAPATSTTTWSTAPATTPCLAPTGPCDNGAFCAGSSPTCLADTFKPSTTTCLAASGPCDDGATCTGSSAACPTDPLEPDGTSCGSGQVCAGGACAADCFIGGLLYPAGTVDPADACQVCTPASATAAWSSATDGTTCTDGNACTLGDTCQAGSCASGTPVTCTAMDECHAVGTCDPTSGTCSNPALPDGAVCSLGTCQAGACTPAPDAGSNAGADAGSDAGSGAGTGGSVSSSSSGTGGAASSSTAGSGGATASSGSGAGTPTGGGGCGCRMAGGEPGSPVPWPLGALGGLGLLVAARRRCCQECDKKCK